jgi:hypothetical protein
VAQETYNDEQRIKVSIYRMEKIADYARVRGLRAAGGCR